MAPWPAWIGELGGSGARSARSWLAASGGSARGDERGRGAMKVRGRFEPAQALAVAVAASRCACAVCAPHRPLAYSQLTTPACASSAAPVQPGRPSTTTRDVSETSELLYHEGRVGLGASATTWRCSAACATTLLNTVAEEGGAAGGRGVLGPGEALGWWRVGSGSSARARWWQGRAAAARGGRREERARPHRT